MFGSLNPPWVVALTAAEITVGWWLIESYPAWGGLIIGLSIGCFVTRMSVSR